MKLQRYATLLMMALVICFALAGPAMAQQIKGGHDETSEVNNGRWANGAPSLGSAPALTGSHLLISEFATQGTPIEFIEIYNPTSEPVDLTHYYITDAWYEGVSPYQGYHLYPGGTFQITTNTDFCAKFPDGAVIQPSTALVIGLYAPGIDSAYAGYVPGAAADFEMCYVPGYPVPDMIMVGNNSPTWSAGATTLTNGAEFIMLFFWDGVSDNVCDVDYVTYGTAGTTTRVDKTGVAVDGPDVDAIATAYNNDTADASQSSVTAAAAGSSTARTLGDGVESSNGNGCVAGGPTAIEQSTWGQIKALYR
jgi:hypothetical protein